MTDQMQRVAGKPGAVTMFGMYQGGPPGAVFVFTDGIVIALPRYSAEQVPKTYGPPGGPDGMDVGSHLENIEKALVLIHNAEEREKAHNRILFRFRDAALANGDAMSSADLMEHLGDEGTFVPLAEIRNVTVVSKKGLFKAKGEIFVTLTSGATVARRELGSADMNKLLDGLRRNYGSLLVEKTA